MYGFFIYNLKAGVCLAVFYLFFKLLLSRETFHRFNRVLVLAGMGLAFALPLCVVTVYRELPAVPVTVADAVPEQAAAVPEEAGLGWPFWAGLVFVAGAAAVLLRMLVSLASVLRTIRSGRRERLEDGTVLVRVPGPAAPFSWWRYAVVSDDDLAANGREILCHERAHVRLGHSADLLATDLAGCLQWFNPAMWLLRRELRAIHEYEADRAVIEDGADARAYQLLLIRKAVGGRWYSVANSFNHSKLKNRITMMLREKSPRWAGARALFVVPLTAVAVGAFAETAYVVPDDKVNKESVTVVVRNTDSLSQRRPLYIVNGKEVPKMEGFAPEEIASIDICKNSATVARYGEKARNGVIFVTLKKEDDSRKLDEVVVVSYGKDSAPSEKGSESDNKTIVVSGFPAEGQTGTSNVAYVVDGTHVEDARTIDPNEIQTITVLKGIPAELREQGFTAVALIQTKKAAKALKKMDAYFESDEWKTAQKQMVEAGAYFESDEWKAAQKQIEAAAKKGAKAGNSVELETAGQVVAIRADGDVVVHSAGSGSGELSDDCLIFINGKRSTKKDMAKIPSGKIRSMDIYKGQSAVDKFGPEAAGGVIDIRTRKKTK